MLEELFTLEFVSERLKIAPITLRRFSKKMGIYGINVHCYLPKMILLTSRKLAEHVAQTRPTPRSAAAPVFWTAG